MSSSDDEPAVAGPKDLDADAQENEGRQDFGHQDAPVTPDVSFGRRGPAKRLLPTSSGDDEPAVAGPKDLDADAQENEGRQAYDDIDAVLAQ